jgi:hypothetical protein
VTMSVKLIIGQNKISEVNLISVVGSGNLFDYRQRIPLFAEMDLGPHAVGAGGFIGQLLNGGAGLPAFLGIALLRLVFVAAGALVEVHFFPFVRVHNAGGSLQSYYELVPLEFFYLFFGKDIFMYTRNPLIGMDLRRMNGC